MASDVHKRLVQLLIPRIVGLGYRIVACDQRYPVFMEERPVVPPTISRHSPDIIGARDLDPILCVGEAKTAGDVGSKRSREQLADFAGTPDCMVIVAVPSSALGLLQSVMSMEGITIGSRFECMAVPDELLQS
jgi:hypothetical protein